MIAGSVCLSPVLVQIKSFLIAVRGVKEHNLVLIHSAAHWQAGRPVRVLYIVHNEWHVYMKHGTFEYPQTIFSVGLCLCHLQ